MPGWLQAILIAAAVVVASWLLLIVLARRLPPGVAKDLAGFLPDCVTAMRVLRRDPRVPRRAKIALLVAVLWVLSPIDLIPEFLPVIGPLDDVIAVALLLRYAGRTVPRSVLLEAWPGDPYLIERLLAEAGITLVTGVGGPPPEAEIDRRVTLPRPAGRAMPGLPGDARNFLPVDADGRVGIDFGVYGVPETFVIDRDGVIRLKHIGPLTPDVLATKIEHLEAGRPLARRRSRP